MAAPNHSPLELLLPAGSAGRSLVLGSACPPRLRPGSEAATDEPVDLLVLAPSESECRERGWLRGAAATAGARLTDEGVVYLLAPRRWRRRARTALAREGLAVEAALVHLPDVAESRHIVPLDRVPARHAFAQIVPLTPWKRTAVGALLAVRGAWLAAAALRNVALVARRRGAHPLFDWLHRLDGEDFERHGVVLTASWRAGGPTVVLHSFTGADARAVVAKVSLTRRAEPATEGSLLAHLAPAAREAGAAVPEPLAGTQLDGSNVLLETWLDGQVLAPLLARRPNRLADALARVHAWFEEWQRLTASSTRLAAEQLEAEVLAPARRLAPVLESGEEYLAALTARCAALEGTLVPVTSSHNDLTMWNVLLDRRGRLGIVDWEAARGGTLPFKDFPYAVVDAVAATRRYEDRLAALTHCFGALGAHSQMVASMRASLAEAVGAPPEAVELSFHACWLGHAANEQRDAAPSDERPFRDMVQWIARDEAARALAAERPDA